MQELLEGKRLSAWINIRTAKRGRRNEGEKEDQARGGDRCCLRSPWGGAHELCVQVSLSSNQKRSPSPAASEHGEMLEQLVVGRVGGGSAPGSPAPRGRRQDRLPAPGSAVRRGAGRLAHGRAPRVCAALRGSLFHPFGGTCGKWAPITRRQGFRFAFLSFY